MEHYEKLSRGEGIPPQHRHKELVIENAKASADEMRARIQARTGKVEAPKTEKTKKSKD